MTDQPVPAQSGATVASPSIGVIVVNFNSGEYLGRCINTLLATPQPVSVVVIDNHSSDESVAAIRDLDTGQHNLRIVENSENEGFSRAVNTGRSHLDCEYILLLNPDCTVHPHTLGKLHSVLRDNSQCGLVGPLVFNEDGTEQRGCRRNEPTLRRSMITSLWLGNKLEGVDQTGQPMPDEPVAVDAVSGSCMMLSAKLFDEIGGMDDGFFLHCEDLDLCHRVRDAGYQVIFTPRVSVFHRQGGSGGTGFRHIEVLKHQGMLRYYKKHYAGEPGLRAWLVTLVIQLMVWSHYVMALGIHLVRRLFSHVRQPVPASEYFVPLEQARVVVTGANSDVGDCLLQRLSDQNETCLAVTRDVPKNPVFPGNARVRWLANSYFAMAPADDLPSLENWVHLAPIWAVREYQPLFTVCGVKRVIGLGSTSVEARAGSTDTRERRVVTALKRGEQDLITMAESNQGTWTILRPTLIYGGPRNRNINIIKRIVRLAGRFPVVGKADGKRQPVHADDVAIACQALIQRPEVCGTYNIPGGEVLDYAEMVGRVFTAMGRRPRIIVISEKFAMALIRLLRWLPGFAMLSPQIARRMSRDQEFSAERAATDFGYDPGPFRP